jgi:tetratricopeptide (TPR) repeat protein
MKPALLLGLLCVLAFTVRPAYAQRSKITTGQIALANKKPADAARLIAEGLKDSVNLKPKDLAKGNMNLAQALMQIHEISSTLPEVAKPFPNRLIDAYRALRSARRNDLDNKFKAEIETIYPSLVNALSIAGNEAYEKEKDYAKSIQYLDATLDLFSLMDQNLVKPYIPQMVMLKAYAQMAKGDTAQAINSFMTYTRVTPDTVSNYVQNYNNLVLLVRTYEKNEEKALALLEEGRKRFPENAALRDQELSILRDNDQLRERAVVKFTEEYTKSPDNIYVALNYAEMLQQSKRVDEAEQVYQKLTKLDDSAWEKYQSSRWIAFFNYAAINVNKGKALIDATNERIEKKTLSNKDYETEKNKWKVFLTLAMPMLEKAHEYEPKNLDILTSLVQVSFLLEDSAKSEEYSRRKKALVEGGN